MTPQEQGAQHNSHTDALNEKFKDGICAGISIGIVITAIAALIGYHVF